MATYADDIKRLAQGDRLRDALGAWAARESIGGSVTPYVNSAFAAPSSGAQSGTDNSTADSTNDNGSIEQDGTQPTDGASPKTFYKGGGGGTQDAAQTGEQDAESVINGEVPQQVSGNDYQSTNYDGPGAMTSMTNMTDCNDKNLKVRFDGEYAPPDGWEDPDSPPIDPTFVSGESWVFNQDAGISFAFATAGEAESVAAAFIEGGGNTNDFYISFKEWTSGWYLVGGDAYNRTYLQNTSLGGVGLFTVGVQRYACSNSFVSNSENGYTTEICLSATGESTQWPIDEKYDLSLVDGSFKPNQYDSEAPENAGGSSVDIKYGASGTGRITATAQGGYMVYATTGCGGAATGTVKVYNKDGTFAAAGNATQTFIDQYLPV